jgi:hypothetical protein
MQVHDTRIISWGLQVLDALIKMPKSKVLKIFPVKVMDLIGTPSCKFPIESGFEPKKYFYCPGSAMFQGMLHSRCMFTDFHHWITPK